MEENIEVKDVQKTEYLDKNGLDMLWAKVKENTHNQVEVERNRAVAKENSIIDTKADKSALDDYALNTALTALQKKVTANTTAISGKQDAGKYIPYEKFDNSDTYVLPNGQKIELRVDFGEGIYNSSKITAQDIFVKNASGNYIDIGSENIRVDSGGNTSNDRYLSLTPSSIGIFDKRGSRRFHLDPEGIRLEGGDNNHILTSGGSTINITQYAKKTDIPEVDTSDFVSKTTTDAQIINSTLGIVGGGIQIVDYTENSDPVTLELHSSELAFNGCDRSTIILNASDVNSNNGSRIIIEAYNENPKITLQGNVGSDYGFSNNLTITNEGIFNTDNNANYVYATDGSIADLTQYAKKSELPTVPTNTSQLQNDSEFITKSVYDEKIATLEARIAALEAKHAETA